MCLSLPVSPATQDPRDSAKQQIMSLFKTVRNLLGLALLLTLVGAGYLAFQNRELVNSAKDAYWAFSNKTEVPPHYEASVTGKVIKVLDGNWFHLKIPEGFVYAVRIAGMEAPGIAITRDPANPPQGNLSRTNLTELILDQDVDVNILEMNDLRYGQGFVYLDGTNVAQLTVTEGMARLNREEIHGLEFEEKYRLVQAERQAQEMSLGVYQVGQEFAFTTMSSPPAAAEPQATSSGTAPQDATETDATQPSTEANVTH